MKILFLIMQLRYLANIFVIASKNREVNVAEFLKNSVQKCDEYMIFVIKVIINVCNIHLLSSKCYFMYPFLYPMIMTSFSSKVIIINL